jgi:hypothetical protein
VLLPPTSSVRRADFGGDSGGATCQMARPLPPETTRWPLRIDRDLSQIVQRLADGRIVVLRQPVMKLIIVSIALGFS